MMRKLFVCLFALMLINTAAFGQVETKEQLINDGKWRLTFSSFEKECPVEASELLARYGYGDWQCEVGASVERKPIDPEDPRGQLNALVVVEKNGLRSLIGLSPSAVWDYGTLGLPLDRIERMEASNTGKGGVQPCITMETADMTYHFWDDGVQGWFLSGWETKEGFCAEWYPRGQLKAEKQTLPVWRTPYLKHAGLLNQLPQNMQELIAFTESSIQEWKATGLAMLSEVNLRSKPTASSEWLGSAHAGTLVKVLDRQQGKNDYWYQIQIGDFVCWASGPYVHLPEHQTISHLPLPIAYSNKEISLWDSGRRNELCVLPEGTKMQILAEMKDNWMIAAVLQGDLPEWRMEPNSPIGWVHQNDLNVEW